MNPPSKRVKTWGYYANQQQQKHKSKYAWEWGRPHTITIKISAQLRFLKKTFFHCQGYLFQHSFHPHPHSQVCKLMNLSVRPHFSDDSWIQGGAAIEASNGLSGNLSNTFNPSLILKSSQQLCPKCLQTSQTVLYNTTPSPPPIIPSLANSDASLPIGKRGSPLHSAPSTSHKLHIPHNPIFTLSTSPISLPCQHRCQSFNRYSTWLLESSPLKLVLLLPYPYHSSPYKRKHNSG